jgi:hypothetical protein
MTHPLTMFHSHIVGARLAKIVENGVEGETWASALYT